MFLITDDIVALHSLVSELYRAILHQKRVLAELQRLGAPASPARGASTASGKPDEQRSQRKHMMHQLDRKRAGCGRRCTKRLGGGVTLVAAADREEVIGCKFKIVLRCTIFKDFVNIASASTMAMTQDRQSRDQPRRAASGETSYARLTHLFPFA